MKIKKNRNVKALPILVLFSVIAMGTGPCDMMDSGDEAAADGGPCGTLTCEHQLLVEVLKAETEPFRTGLYKFSFLTQEQNSYWIECIMYDESSGLDCSAGNTPYIKAFLYNENRTILLDLMGRPAAIQVLVEYNGEQIGMRTLMPAYQEISPNGPGCQPVCGFAKEAIAVSQW